jgi:hypothetical protein
MAAIHWGTHYIHQRKIPKYCLTASSGGFEYGTKLVRENSDIHPQVSAAGSITYETRSFRQKLLAGHCTLFKAKCMIIKAAKKF